MKTEVDVWLALAKQTKAAMEQAISGFQALSNTYSDMRDIGFKANEKEAIDQHYSKVNEARAQLAGLAAGGGRKRRHRTRKHKGRK